MNLMNKIIQSKERNKKIIFIAVICILIIGIVGLLVFNTIDNSSAKLDNKGNTAGRGSRRKPCATAARRSSFWGSR